MQVPSELPRDSSGFGRCEGILPATGPPDPTPPDPPYMAAGRQRSRAHPGISGCWAAEPHPGWNACAALLGASAVLRSKGKPVDECQNDGE
ncbi:hypothetical protein AGIG_G18276 [Arapaima gigas]